ncbi:MAG: cadherin-like domain-containing protein [Steroidobacteraceae bacterium]|nr:cadherin-like domain-containing protein [Steroidobacteraceae bacterium]
MRRVLPILAACAAFASFAIFAAVFRPVQLLVDINQAPTPLSSSPRLLCDSTVAGYLSATDADQTLGLWRTDGSTAGTTRIATFGAFNGFEQVECLYWRGSLTFFQFTDQGGVAELWRSDGTSSGTFRLLRQPSANEGPIYFMGQSGLYAFMASDGIHGNEIMLTDGTVAGTRMLIDLTPGPDSSWIGTGQNTVSNGLLYFGHEGNLWVSDFSAGGTRAVTDFDIDPNVGSSLDTLWSYRGGVLFRYGSSDQVNSLYFSDGTSSGTRELLGIPAAPNLELIGSVAVRGDLALFMVLDYGTGATELWTTDGTVANTRHIPGPNGDLDAGPWFSAAASRLLFYGSTAATGREVWTSDGTDAGTFLLHDFSPGPDNSSVIVNQVSSHYSSLRVMRSDGTRPIWITDGTQAGTRSVTDLHASLAADTFNLFDAGFIGDDLYIWKFESLAFGATQNYQLWRYTPTTHQLVNRGSMSARELSPAGTLLNQRLLFTTDDPVRGSEPWASDGSMAGTGLLANLAIEPSNGSSDPGPYLPFGDVALFGATGSDGREGLWRSDGTAAGSVRLANGAPVGSSTPYNPRYVRLGNQLLYGGKLAYDKWELFSTDGTAAGTRMVIDLSSEDLPFLGLWTSNPAACGVGFATLNGRAYYGASPARVGTLYRTDGTAAGTESLGRFPTSARVFAPSSQVCIQAAYRNHVYFVAEDPVTGAYPLWRNDGTADGNTHVKTAAGRDLTISEPMVEIDSRLYFVASDGVQRGLWRSEGEPANTVMLFSETALPEQSIGPLFAVGSTIYFTNCSGSTTVCRLYRTDGTTAGTFFLAVTDNDYWTQLAGNPVTFDGKLLFTGKSTEHGEEPWITDGTTAGTRMLSDIVTGPEGSSPSSAFRFNGLTYFYVTRNDGSYVLKDLWRTDGTPANTERANLMPASSRVLWESAGVVGQKVLLTGYNETIGNELWMVENEAPVAQPDAASTTSGVAVDIDAASNDSDPDGLIDSTTLRIVQAPAQGTAVTSGGRLRYTPNAGFEGTATFTYAISDRQQRESVAAAVTVTVTAPPVTAPPVTAPPVTANPPAGAGGRGGGGGRFDVFLLGALALLAASRRRRSLLEAPN